MWLFVEYATILQTRHYDAAKYHVLAIGGFTVAGQLYIWRKAAIVGIPELVASWRG